MSDRRRFPVVTLLMTSGVALLFMLTRDDADLLALLYSRAGLANFELWRLWSAHLVHFSWTHVAADLGGFTLLGLLIEREQGKAVLLTLLISIALGTSLALWFFVPTMWFYGGVSALNYGLLTWLCLTDRNVSHSRWQWLAGLLPLLILAHIGWQYTTENSLFLASLPRSVRIAWQAHLAAVVLAFVFASLRVTVARIVAVKEHSHEQGHRHQPDRRTGSTGIP